MDQPGADVPADAQVRLAARIRGAVLDVMVILLLMALGLVGMGLGILIGMVAGFMFAGLRARHGLWTRVSFAWLGLALLLMVILLPGFCRDDPADKLATTASLHEVLGLSVVVLSVPAFLGGGIAWIIRRWRPAKA